MSELTHFTADGAAQMVDIGDKRASRRLAIAGGRIRMRADTLALISQGGHKKGDVLGIARTAGIMAAKQTAALIPLCHPLGLTHIHIELNVDAARSAVECRCRAETEGRTGVEMEALTAVQISLLTIYDMCKALDRGMVMSDIRLLEKAGGKSGHWRADSPEA